MYDFQMQELVEGNITHFYILKNDVRISFYTYIELLKTSHDFRMFFNNILKNIPYPAYYWETPSVRNETSGKQFEFVLVKSAPLENVQQDIAAFEEYFTQNEDVVSFTNLSGDAKLVVPCPVTSQKAYAHLAQFVRNAPPDQIDALWHKVAIEYEKAIEKLPHWLSTAGLGISWLHVRIDTRPKYYRYQPYKEIM